jgi:hypothetical protein
VWISEQTAIISLYSINWLAFIIEAVCLLRGTDWIFKYNLRQKLNSFTPHQQHTAGDTDISRSAGKGCTTALCWFAHLVFSGGSAVNGSEHGQMAGSC